MREAVPARLANGRAGAGGVGGACGWTFNRGNENSKGNTLSPEASEAQRTQRCWGGEGRSGERCPCLTLLPLL